MSDISPGEVAIDTSSSPKSKPIRVLALDGGGVRGLSSLLLLRGITDRVAVAKGVSSDSTVTVRPSEYFDLIIGTGTGGISALFLGRLRMTVNEAIAAYQDVAKAAFQPLASNAKATFEVIGDRRGAAYCLKALGDIQCKLNHYIEAQQMVSNAQTTFEAIGDKSGAAHCMKTLGHIQYKLHYYNEAQQVLSDAQTRYESIGHRHGVEYCLKILGNIQHMIQGTPLSQGSSSPTMLEH